VSEKEPPVVPFSVDDAIVLMMHELARDDLDRASKWLAPALSVNDPKEPADA
jgi:hypothetical protein